ncbi:MAG: hypothetical protein CVU44_02925 [Chloroflexi bacterium HGW-Chloroflexi-6]|nr:MAG: hypothetical protein CVU44_02925 [Chloroflexi bacterium HGW-Chloroflexi-6]
MNKHLRLLPFIFVIGFLLSACNLPIGRNPAIPPTATEPAHTETATPSATATLTETSTPSPTATSTITLTPTETETPTITPTATFAFPVVTVNKQAHCRYGPSTAFLHAADLYAGDVGTVRGRFQYSKWLYIKFDKLGYFCWVAPSVVDVVGDVNTILMTEVRLPGPSVLYKPPQNVYAERVGDKKVKISWDQVKMTQDDDRGYMLELFVCQNGAYIWYTASIPDQYTTSYVVEDGPGCAVASSGAVYAVEKHGYTTSTKINWPAP